MISIKLIASLHANLDVQLAGCVGLLRDTLRNDEGHGGQLVFIKAVASVDAHLVLVLGIVTLEVETGDGGDGTAVIVVEDIVPTYFAKVYAIVTYVLINPHVVRSCTISTIM
jgi:hypothetical protein